MDSAGGMTLISRSHSSIKSMELEFSRLTNC